MTSGTWTKCSDELPPPSTHVIGVTYQGRVTMTTRAAGGKGSWHWHSNGRQWPQSNITHWMPMPEAPAKEDAK